MNERELVRLLVQILTTDQGAARAVTDLFAGSAPPGHPVSDPVRWQREFPIGRYRFSVDAVGWSADDSPGIVVEAKSHGARFQVGQASEYGKWQQENLAAGGFGLLAFIVPDDRSDEIWMRVRSELPHAEQAGDAYVIPGPARVAVVRVTWDDIVVALWSAVAPDEAGADGATIRELMTECARGKVSAPVALSEVALGRGPEALPDMEVLVAAVCRKVKLGGVHPFLSQPAGGGFLMHHYVGSGPPWMSIGVRQDPPLALWVRWKGDTDRVVRALDGTRWKPQFTPSDADCEYAWIRLPITPAEGPGRRQIDELAESVVDLWRRTSGT
jgi:hypothetical protein